MTSYLDYIEILKSVKKRKGMYIHPVSIDAAATFLTGFMCAVMAEYPEKRYPNEIIHKIGSEHGWKECAVGPVYHLKKSDLSENDMINEIIDIYIETLHQLEIIG